MADIAPEDIWRFIYEHDEVRSRDLEKWFVDEELPVRISRGTMYKYKEILEREGKIKAKPVLEARPPYNVYYVPKEFHNEVEVMIRSKKMHAVLDDLSLKEQLKTMDLWLEIEMVVRSMKKMGYTSKEIHCMVEDALEELHTRLVNRIVGDARTDDST